MAGVVQHLRSSTLNKRPNPGSMVDGQVAVNYASGSPGLFFKDSNGSLVKAGPVHVGSTAPNASPASGGTAGNSIGEQWLDNTGGTYVLKIWDGSTWRSETTTGFAQLATTQTFTAVQTFASGISLSNSSIASINTATFNSQVTISGTTGAITINWTAGQNQRQPEPTGAITYTFTAPAGPCHLQLLIDSDGTSTAQTITWPGSVVFLGSTWAGANNKKSVLNFWYDGTNYFAIGTNQV